jgi:ribosomal protein L37AE/L43A
MKIEIPCPACGHSPADVLRLRDGEVWLCLGCGYQEISAGVDVEAHLVALAAVDPRLAARWRDALGLVEACSGLMRDS